MARQDVDKRTDDRCHHREHDQSDDVHGLVDAQAVVGARVEKISEQEAGHGRQRGRTQPPVTATAVTPSSIRNSSPAIPSEDRSGSETSAIAAGASKASSQAAARRRAGSSTRLAGGGSPIRPGSTGLGGRRAGITWTSIAPAWPIAWLMTEAVPELIAPRATRGAEDELVGLLGGGEVEHRGGYVIRRHLAVAAAEGEQQPLLALQPNRWTAHVRGRRPHVHAHELGP